MSWYGWCEEWRLRAEETGGRFLWANPRTGKASLLWGRKVVVVRQW